MRQVRNILSVLLSFFLLAPLPTHAYAAVFQPEHGVNTWGAGGGWEAGRASILDSIRERLQTHSSRSAESLTARCDRLQEQGKRIFTKYQQRIERMNKYLERVQSRRTKLQTLGKDVSKIDKSVNDIKAHIAKVQAAINQQQPTLTTVNCSSDLKAQAQAMRSSMQKIRQTFSQGNHLLQNTVHELRGATIHK